MNNKKQDKIHISIMILIGLLFFFCVGENRDYVLLRDSESYINTDISYAYWIGTMPGYIVFINICEAIFHSYALRAVIVLQGIIAIFASILLTELIRKEYMLSNPFSIAIYVLSFLPYCYSLPEEVATHEILTEPISFSLFYIMISLLLYGLYHHMASYIIASVGINLIILFIRKQAILFLPVLLYSLIYSVLHTEMARKKLKSFTFLAAMISVLTGIFILIFAYPRISNIAADQVLYSYAGKTIYMSDKTDIDTYQDTDEQKVFGILYEYADEGKMLYRYADDSDEMIWQHAINGFNYTTRTVWGNIITYCRDNGLDDQTEPVLLKNVVFHQIKLHPGRFLRALYIPFGQSLISSIFIKPSAIYNLCAVITALLYIGSIILFFICKKNDRVDDKACKMYSLTMSILIINVLALNVLFQSLQRYVVYTWGLFYISIVLMLYSLIKAMNSTDHAQ